MAKRNAKIIDEKSTATIEQLDFRSRLGDLFRNSPLPPDDLMFNLGMYVRSTLFVKFLVMNELYERIKNIPGTLLEFGVWWGQNLVLLENLRAIHEPFNKQRVIIGFDTFSGYENFSDKDNQSAVFQDESYRTQADYQLYLEKLLEIHEGNNAFGHIRGNHKLIAGDVTKTAPKYFKDHPETIVAMAYFDIGIYKPTKSALEAIKPHLIPGSIILLDELTWQGGAGEAIAFKEVFGNVRYGIEKCQLYPSKTIVTIK
jgi:hypothetical protein